MEAQKQRAVLDSGLADGLLGNGNPDAIAWPAAIRYAVLAGALAAALNLLALAVPPVILLAWFWAIGAPVVVLGIYNSKIRPSRLRAGFGATLGLLCGLAITFGMSVINASGLVLGRFVFHNGPAIDTAVAAAFAQFRTTVQQQGGPAQASLLNWLNIPEDRLGLILITSAVALLIYLGLSALGGAFAALLRSRSEPRDATR
ncbi:MAG TPA: hypothetical protein VGU25_01960 [Acidobacteriaceae bacterium]|nr:hypothetical protein [Acidobacteriaceae bacterium]